MKQTTPHAYSLDADLHYRVTVRSADGFDEMVVATVDVDNALQSDAVYVLQLGTLTAPTWSRRFGSTAAVEGFLDRHLGTLQAITGEWGTSRLPSQVRAQLDALT